MNMKPHGCTEMSLAHGRRTEWHNDDLRDYQRLDEAWAWLCESRKTAPPNADIWDLRHRWPAYRDAFLRQLQSGAYRLSPMLVVGARRQVMWSAEDALALKWVALSITPSLPLHEKCEHVKGHGGGKSSVRRVSQCLTGDGYRRVCRADIKGYYGAINKETLLSQLRQLITRPGYLNVLTQYVHYSVEKDGEFYTPEKGIARGCALSPLMGALHLWAVDNYFAHQHKIYYGRYMDDFVILTHTRWQLRKQVKQLNKYLASLGFETHPDKTFIGKVSRGFDWMGAWLTDRGTAGIAPRALANHLEKVRRLYEQTRRWSKARQARRVADYRYRWKIWATATATALSASFSASGLELAPGGTFTQPVSANIPAAANATGTTYATGVLGEPLAGQICAAATCLLKAYAPPTNQIITTTDGWTGYRLADDVVLTMQGTMTGGVGYNGEIMNVVGTWDSRGNFSTSNGSVYSTYTWQNAVDRSNFPHYSAGSTWATPTTFNGSVVIHAGPQAVPNAKFTVPPVWLGKYVPAAWDPSAKQTQLYAGGTLRIVTPTACTVVVDTPNVSFGVVTDTDRAGDPLAVRQTQLTTSCTAVDDGGAGSNKVETTLSLTADTTSPDSALMLTSPETSQPVASVHARLGTFTTGSCQPGSDSPDFVGTPMALGAFPVGDNMSTITWTLCSNGQKNRSSGSGRATLTVGWP